MLRSNNIVLTLSFKVLILLLIALVAGIPFVNDVSAYIQGLFLGGIFTILKIKLIENTIKRAVDKEANAATNFARVHYMLRYFLTFCVLFVGIAVPSINGVAVIIGLLSLKIAAFWQGALEPKTPLDGSVEFVEWEDDEEESDF